MITSHKDNFKNSIEVCNAVFTDIVENTFSYEVMKHAAEYVEIELASEPIANMQKEEIQDYCKQAKEDDDLSIVIKHGQVELFISARDGDSEFYLDECGFSANFYDEVMEELAEMTEEELEESMGYRFADAIKETKYVPLNS